MSTEAAVSPATTSAPTASESELTTESGRVLLPPKRDAWRARYARMLRITDLLVLVWVVYGTQIIWFGLGRVDVAVREDSRLNEFSYWLFSAFLVIVWMLALALADSRSDRVIGTGATEYARLAGASLGVFGAIAIIAFLTRVDVARGYLLISLPAGIFFLLLTRWLWRQWLVAQRQAGRYSANVLLVGSRQSVAQVARDLQRSASAGYRVVGACVPHGKVADVLEGTGIPIMGNVDSIDRALAVTGADTVVVTSTDDLPTDKVKQISWSLEAGRQHLVLAPSITDIAGPRIHTRPVAGLPLIHVETPNFSAGQRLLKRTMDLSISLVGVVAISPVLLTLALVVKLSSPGPVIFRQTRVGYHGQEFQMLKFRSMVVDAEDRLDELKASRRQDVGNRVLFKMAEDPRVTRAGRIMRRFSLDELPQLFNVIGGSMSLVGPRPPLRSEVAAYEAHVHRRFLAKPGVTGAWQVGGRSTLSWEDSVRLDLGYVENWSLVGDLMILARTLRAIVGPQRTAF
ncbi:sugar transferase [Microbacterium sp. W1N]|uniref:sugar transferase n=1 Tax=Microbacterium festucae TaxID=2977531 RepID=UPI0021C1B9DA|nr:sugar transferase [Microbacterium festucae]MCT9819028.1 sugar transferase [Microbacterium festucae]